MNHSRATSRASGLNRNLVLREWRLEGKGRRGPVSVSPRIVCPSDFEVMAARVRRDVEALAGLLGEGRIDEAIEIFYSSELTPNPGTWPLLVRRRSWRDFCVQGIGVNGDTSFMECRVSLADPNGREKRIDQVAVAQWHEGRIVQECLLPVS